MFITRVWHGTTRHEDSEKYLEFLLNEGTREYLEAGENLSVKVWQTDENDGSHFWTVTEWPSIAAIRKFSGEDFEKAKYYPQDQGILLEFEERVNHFKSFDVSNRRMRQCQKRFRELFYGGSWQGENFQEKIKDLSEEMAFERPFAGIHCVAEIVWHCIYWRNVFINRVNGNRDYRDQTINQLNFRERDDLLKEGWSRLLDQLMENQVAIDHLLGSRRDSFLDTEYDTNLTYGTMVEGLIDHELYHLGQIGLVTKMLRTKKNGSDHNTMNCIDHDFND